MVWNFCGNAQFPQNFGQIAELETISTNFPHQEIAWNYGILWFDKNTSVQFHSNLQTELQKVTKFTKSKVAKSNQKHWYLPLIVPLTNLSQSTVLSAFICSHLNRYEHTIS